jgi:Restriction endonuclease NaeI
VPLTAPSPSPHHPPAPNPDSARNPEPGECAGGESWATVARVTSGAAPPPQGQAGLPGLTPGPVSADGQGLLPGMAGLAGPQYTAPALIVAGPGTPLASARTDAELGRVAAGLLAADPDGAQIGTAVRQALDMLLDGQHTGRYRWDQLCKTEKTHAGTLVEIGIQRSLALADGDALDYSIAGIDVDCKFSHRMGRWMIPPEAAGRLVLLVQASDEEGTWSAGLLRVRPGYLGAASNRDLKRSLSERGRAAITWLFARSPLQENALVRMTDRDVAAVFAAGSGQQRVNELFRRAQRRRVSRTVVATVARQDDYMKRVRAGGGARDHLRGEGIVIFGDYAGDQALATALALPRPAAGEFVSARLTSRPGEPGRRAVRLESTDWTLASLSDPPERAPRLPRR